VTTTDSARRQLLTIALLGALGLVLVAPLWHHDHHQAGVAVGTDAQRSDLHVCSSGVHGTGPMGICPTCLSQRLLSQAQAEHSEELPLSCAGSGIEAGRLPLIAIPTPRSLRPRAPPAV
jgi:hypothetical protein